jgi:hypothetical protein
MDSFFQDFRYSLRMLWRNPAFTLSCDRCSRAWDRRNYGDLLSDQHRPAEALPYPDPIACIVFINTSPQGSGPERHRRSSMSGDSRRVRFRTLLAFRFNVRQSHRHEQPRANRGRTSQRRFSSDSSVLP